VIEVEIDGDDEWNDDPDSATTIDPALWAAIEKEIAPLFSYTDSSHPAVKELIRMRILREAADDNR
jgi:hypothetical protein